MPNQEVIVLGTTHHNTLGIIRALGESPRHFRCVLMLYGEHQSYLSHSIYVSRTCFVDSSEGIVDALLNLVTNEKQVIIAVTDEAVHQLDLNAERLSPHFHFFGTMEAGQLTQYMDKLEQDKTAEGIGMKVPANYTPDNIVFPCLLKPLASIAGGKRVLICRSKEDYNNYIAQFPTTTFQIQQYLTKDQEIVLVGLSINGEVHIPAYVLKHREMAGGTTYSTVYPIKEMDTEIVSKSKELIAAIGYEGLFGIEFIHCEEKYWFIEVNLRSDATCYAVAVAGVNLPEAYILAKHGESIQQVVTSTIQTIDAIVEFRDFEFVLRREIGILNWLRQRRQCKCLYYYSQADPKPYQINRKNMWKRIISGVTKRF
jgi:predicted ATP-grasp superfamily ATP-dependent carboligase